LSRADPLSNAELNSRQIDPEIRYAESTIAQVVDAQPDTDARASELPTVFQAQQHMHVHRAADRVAFVIGLLVERMCYDAQSPTETQVEALPVIESQWEKQIWCQCERIAQLLCPQISGVKRHAPTRRLVCTMPCLPPTDHTLIEQLNAGNVPINHALKVVVVRDQVAIARARAKREISLLRDRAHAHEQEGR
jgi:hypothetical protein